MIITHTTCSVNQKPCVIIQRQLLHSDFQSCHDDLLKYIDIHANRSIKTDQTGTGFKIHPEEFDETDYFMHRENPSFLSLGQRAISIIESTLSPINTSFYISSTWGNKLVSGNMMKAHSHDGDAARRYVYVYNVSVCENCAPLVFPTIDKKIFLKIGQIIIFSGWLTHAIDVHKCDHPRINVGGNIGREI